jgi:hypothetical protein
MTASVFLVRLVWREQRRLAVSEAHRRAEDGAQASDARFDNGSAAAVRLGSLVVDNIAARIFCAPWIVSPGVVSVALRV